MNKCINCNIYVADKTEICPLCQSVLEETELEKEEDKNALLYFGGGAPYPNIRKWQKRLQFVMRLILFLFIVSEAVLIGINVVTFKSVWWSAICGIAMLYSYFSMIYWLRHDSGPASKIGLQLTLTIVLVMGIDYFSGAAGWSLEWAAPCIILVGDAMVFILMMTNRKQWYSYTLLLLLVTLFSVGVISLYFAGRIQHVVLTLVSAGVTFVYLLGTFIFGDRAIKRELKRRFHI